MARDDEFDIDEDGGSNGPSVFLILLIVVAIVTAIFIGQNRERTKIEFLVFDFNSRVWAAIGIAILLGVVLDRLILSWWRRSRREKDD